MPTQLTDNLQWVSLTDFSPGIYTSSLRALGTVAVPAPLGAAQQTNTYRCVALPGGGLGPLPRQVQTFTVPTPDAYASVTAGYWTTGFFAHGPMTIGLPAQTAYPDQLFVGYDYVIGGTHRHRQYRVRAFNTGFGGDLLDTNNASTSNGVYQAMTFGQTRGTTVAPYTAVGSPEIVSSWLAPGAGTGANDAYCQIFPKSTDYSTVNVQFLTTTFRPSQALTHQGRIVTLEESNYLLSDPTYGTSTNEQISFTDPPNFLPVNGVAMANQNEVFGQEYPSGYGAWGSISAGELMLIKHQGGGIMVSGDIAFPSVTRLPGVTGTGWALNRAASTPRGLFYAALEEGVYSWRGGGTSEKVSRQLQDNFWINSSLPQFLNQYCCLEPWGDWILCSNNWLYDISSGSWWQLDNVATFLHYSRSFYARYCYAAIGGSWSNTNNSVVYTYDRQLPALSYSWQSHPIPASIDRLTEVREMVLVAQGSGAVTVTLTGINPAGVSTTQAETFTVTHADQPQRLRPSVGGTFIKGYNVIVRIESSGDKAPVVYALHLGTRQAQQAVSV